MFTASCGDCVPSPIYLLLIFRDGGGGGDGIGILVWDEHFYCLEAQLFFPICFGSLSARKRHTISFPTIWSIWLFRENFEKVPTPRNITPVWKSNGYSLRQTSRNNWWRFQYVINRSPLNYPKITSLVTYLYMRLGVMDFLSCHVCASITLVMY